MPFRFEPLEIADVVLVTPEPIRDRRGALTESFRRSQFEAAGIDAAFVQENELVSDRGVLRGLNYQLEPHAQGRLVRALDGRAHAVAVDLRAGSPSADRHVARELDGARPEMLWVPPGFAFGVAFLDDATVLSYKASGAEYTPHAKRSIRWDDPALGIAWPIADPILSARDREAPRRADAEANFSYDPDRRRHRPTAAADPTTADSSTHLPSGARGIS